MHNLWKGIIININYPEKASRLKMLDYQGRWSRQDEGQGRVGVHERANDGNEEIICFVGKEITSDSPSLTEITVLSMQKGCLRHGTPLVPYLHPFFFFLITISFPLSNHHFLSHLSIHLIFSTFSFSLELLFRIFYFYFRKAESSRR